MASGTKQRAKGDIAVNFKGIKISPPILSCRMHEHRFWELIYQVDQPTTATVEKEKYRVGAGELIVIPPKLPHRTEASVPFRDISMQFDMFDFPTSPTVVSDEEGRIRALLDTLLSLRDERSAEDALLLERLGEALLLCVKKAAAVAREPSAISQFKKVLLENAENAYFDLDAAIRATGYHPDYFRRTFKQCTAQSPLGYLNRMRVERAKDLLRLEPSLPVGVIAARCGYRDPLYFSTAFRRTVGLSPLAYRRQWV